MNYYTSTFKYPKTKKLKNENIINDNNVNFCSSTLGNNNNNDDCEEYAKFLNEMNKLRAKVKNGDLSEFEEFQI